MHHKLVHIWQSIITCEHTHLQLDFKKSMFLVTMQLVN